MSSLTDVIPGNPADDPARSRHAAAQRRSQTSRPATPQAEPAMHRSRGR